MFKLHERLGLNLARESGSQQVVPFFYVGLYLLAFDFLLGQLLAGVEGQETGDGDQIVGETGFVLVVRVNQQLLADLESARHPE